MSTPQVKEVEFPVWPKPTVEMPSWDEMEDWMWQDEPLIPATDGCMVEWDGVCQHGHPSWLKRFGVI